MSLPFRYGAFHPVSGICRSARPWEVKVAEPAEEGTALRLKHGLPAALHRVPLARRTRASFGAVFPLFHVDNRFFFFFFF